MFEGLTRTASRRAQVRPDEVAAGLREALPRGIEVGVDGDEVWLRGRILAQRVGLDAGLRWLIGEQLQ